ncbi:hypothetical protein NpPPO83_00011999 [Neofusicoccum parvum]|uniref:Uncharacterized protein n=1 Tax=Neofusicoccum parvum TaxID=310453 RepID=A0ACB5SGX1_9PEZI|nr:hypothetical protein NpPPO83_00011999 [Neofusicoccum parvum]
MRLPEGIDLTLQSPNGDDNYEEYAQDEQVPEDAASPDIARHIGNVKSGQGFRISIKVDRKFDFGVGSTIKATVRMILNGHKRWATVFVSRSHARFGVAKTANIFTFNEVGRCGFQKEAMGFGTHEGIVRVEIQLGKYEKRKKEEADGNSSRTYKGGFRLLELEEGSKSWTVEFRFELQELSADLPSLTPPVHHGLQDPGFVFRSKESIASPVWKSSPVVHLRSGPVDDGFKRGAQAELLRRRKERNKITKPLPRRRSNLRVNASPTPVTFPTLVSQVIPPKMLSSPKPSGKLEDLPTVVKSEADAQIPIQVVTISDDEDDREEDLRLDLREIRILKELRRIQRRKNTGG